MQWILSYPSWLLLFLALLSGGLTYLLYAHKDALKDVQPFWKGILGLLRFSAFFLIGLLLFNPLLKHITTITDPPVILVLEDNSSSLLQGWNKQERAIYLKERVPVLKDIQSQFKSYFYSFGSDLKSINPNDTLDFNEISTDIHSALETVMQNHTGSNISAIVLATDGLYNTGSSPLYANVRGVPVYVVALGDTTVRKDLMVRQLRYNDLVYLGDEYSVLIDLSAVRLEGNTTTLTVRNESGTLLKTETISIGNADWSATSEIKIKADKPGINKVTVSVSDINGEVTNQNNIATAYINVIDGRQKVLLLYDAPHPDVRFLKDVLEANKNFETKVSRWADWTGSLSVYDMVILHGLPSVKDRSRSAELVRYVKDAGPVWFITTTNSDQVLLNEMQNMVKLEVSNKTANEVLPRFESAFSRFSISNPALQWLDEVPPLVTPYGNHVVNAGTEVVWYQNIGKVSTKLPLLVTGGNSKKRALLLGEGLWRWAMQEQLRKNVQENTSEWVDRLIQYLAVKTDQRPFRIRAGKDVYNEGEAVTLDASLFNASFQLINEPDVMLNVKGDNGSAIDVVMDKTSNAYSMRLGALAPGTYTASAKVDVNGKTLNTNARFTVRELFLETLQTTADHSLLQSLSLATGGKMLTHRNMQQLPQMLKDDDRIRPLLSEQLTTQSLLDIKWYFFLIIILLSAEWFLRRFLGTY